MDCHFKCLKILIPRRTYERHDVLLSGNMILKNQKTHRTKNEVFQLGFHHYFYKGLSMTKNLFTKCKKIISSIFAKFITQFNRDENCRLFANIIKTLKQFSQNE